MNIHEMQSMVICKFPPGVDRRGVSAGCPAPHGLRSPQTCAQETKTSQMRKRRCNPPWDYMNKSAYHPVLLYWGKDWLEEYKYRDIHKHSMRGNWKTESVGVINVKHQRPVVGWVRDSLYDMNINENVCVGTQSMMSVYLQGSSACLCCLIMENHWRI